MDLDYTDDLDECTEPEDIEELPASLLNDRTSSIRRGANGAPHKWRHATRPACSPTRGSYRLGRTSTTPTANHS